MNDQYKVINNAVSANYMSAICTATKLNGYSVWKIEGAKTANQISARSTEIKLREEYLED